MTDCELILNYLSDGQWHNGITMSKDLKPNCINWAYRSRISNLRQKGFVIERRLGENGCAEYHLVKQGGDADGLTPKMERKDVNSLQRGMNSGRMSCPTIFEGEQAVMNL